MCSIDGAGVGGTLRGRSSTREQRGSSPTLTHQKYLVACGASGRILISFLRTLVRAMPVSVELAPKGEIVKQRPSDEEPPHPLTPHLSPRSKGRGLQPCLRPSRWAMDPVREGRRASPPKAPVTRFVCPPDMPRRWRLLVPLSLPVSRGTSLHTHMGTQSVPDRGSRKDAFLQNACQGRLPSPDACFRSERRRGTGPDPQFSNTSLRSARRYLRVDFGQPAIGFVRGLARGLYKFFFWGGGKGPDRSGAQSSHGCSPGPQIICGAR